MQSHTEVLNFLQENAEPANSKYRVPVISIAPQSLASLAASVSSSSNSPISMRQILRRVEAFCTKVLGFEHVYDTTFARHVTLLEHSREFLERKEGTGEGKLPMLASACPGWICYAEKTHAEMLPFISRTKSPQQVMGTLVKSWLGSKWHKTSVVFPIEETQLLICFLSSPDEIYHVTVMPCYDKKLEASRQDFYNDTYSTRDVDCVITTGELELMMREKNWDISEAAIDELVPTPPRTPPHGTEIPELITHPGTSSGSYLHSVISSIRAGYGGFLELSIRTVRSSDYEEYTLADRDTGEVVFKGAKCFGFRNLQNVVRKIGKETGVQVGRGAAGRMVGLRGRASRKADAGEKERHLDYVEVMACPGGCVNGGGQLKPSRAKLLMKEDEEGYERDWAENGVEIPSSKWGDKGWTKEVEMAYWHDLPTPLVSPRLTDLALTGPDHIASRVLMDLCVPSSQTGSMAEVAEAKRRELFRTQYHAVEGEVDGLIVKW
jgi:iron only hydrogenase large subunit-like protein